MKTTMQKIAISVVACVVLGENGFAATLTSEQVDSLGEIILAGSKTTKEHSTDNHKKTITEAMGTLGAVAESVALKLDKDADKLNALISELNRKKANIANSPVIMGKNKIIQMMDVNSAKLAGTTKDLKIVKLQGLVLGKFGKIAATGLDISGKILATGGSLAGFVVEEAEVLKEAKEFHESGGSDYLQSAAIRLKAIKSAFATFVPFMASGPAGLLIGTVDLGTDLAVIGANGAIDTNREASMSQAQLLQAWQDQALSMVNIKIKEAAQQGITLSKEEIGAIETEEGRKLLNKLKSITIVDHWFDGDVAKTNYERAKEIASKLITKRVAIDDKVALSKELVALHEYDVISQKIEAMKATIQQDVKEAQKIEEVLVKISDQKVSSPYDFHTVLIPKELKKKTIGIAEKNPWMADNNRKNFDQYSQQDKARLNPTTTISPIVDNTPIVSPTISSALAGMVIDVLKTSDATYALILNENTYNNQFSSNYFWTDYGQPVYYADLNVVKIANNQTVTQTLGSYYAADSGMYAGNPHPGSLGINSNNELKVFSDYHTRGSTGYYDMTGALFTLNASTLGIKNSSILFSNASWGGDFSTFLIGGNVYNPFTRDEEEAFIAFHSKSVMGDSWTHPYASSSYEGLSRLIGTSTAEKIGGYDYVSWGKWNDPVNIPLVITNHWVDGKMLQANDLPALGSATYNGIVLGTGTTDNGVTNVALNGTSAINVNFGTKAVTGTLNIKNASTNATWATATVNANMQNNQNIFTGTLYSTAGQSGGIAGAFYGAGAKEVGGNWTLNVNAWGNTRAAGIFAGKK